LGGWEQNTQIKMPSPLEKIQFDAIELIAPSLRRRLACWMYEGMLLFAVLFIASYLFSSLSQTRHALDNRHAQQAFLFIILGIYFTWFWSKGQTLAMKTWHVRVVDVRGQGLSQHRALVRYLVSWLWFLPPFMGSWIMGWSITETGVIATGWVLIWAFLSRFHPQRQYWHDVLAGTRLIQASDLIEKQKR
jgi:uncharacterized RDD family membrane protein YckC